MAAKVKAARNEKDAKVAKAAAEREARESMAAAAKQAAAKEAAAQALAAPAKVTGTRSLRSRVVANRADASTAGRPFSRLQEQGMPTPVAGSQVGSGWAQGAMEEELDLSPLEPLRIHGEQVLVTANQELQQELADLKAKLEIAKLKRRLQEVSQPEPAPPVAATAVPAESAATVASEPPATAGRSIGVEMPVAYHGNPLLPQRPAGNNPQVLGLRREVWGLHRNMGTPSAVKRWHGRGSMNSLILQAQPQAVEPTVTMAQMLRAALLAGNQGGGQPILSQANLSFDDFCNAMAGHHLGGGR
ncbi:hypothetical protein CYMTET_18252 [Cymbomonas tetramitiformis]|uniref:Uncharacterized protein n=1 Tax=Cymbomonas tetramitiformis TaxID=36881 RepID=A0AAE0G8W4_9CHLO|nr:hypothetical protein CYMTET_18252 [Cymbomonas tetramitiformis]